MSQSLIRLYGFKPFDRSGKVRWLLTEMGLDFENQWLDPEKGDLQKPEYLKLHPMGRVPVIQTGDFSMFESNAICAYLSDQNPRAKMAPAPATSTDDLERKKFEQWMYFAVATVEPMMTRIQIIEDIPPGEYQKTKEKELQDDLRAALTALDTVLSRNQYLVANRFSTADICVSYHLNWLTYWPELNGVFEPFKSVTAYLARVKALPSAVKSEVFSFKG